MGKVSLKYIFYDGIDKTDIFGDLDIPMSGRVLFQEIMIHSTIYSVVSVI